VLNGAAASENVIVSLVVAVAVRVRSYSLVRSTSSGSTRCNVRAVRRALPLGVRVRRVETRHGGVVVSIDIARHRSYWNFKL
jgi:hypothetical protein